MDINWKFFLSPDAAWDAMYRDCETAETSIDLEQYIFNDDRVGRRFIDLFVKKAKAGVRVRLLLDSAGSYFLYRSGTPARLTAQGITIDFFNPLSPWRLHNFTSWFFRDHRKILIVDDRVAYTGGVGINARMSDWRDTQIRVTGPIVSEFRYNFDRMWQMVKRGRFLKIKRPAFLPKDFTFVTNAPHFQRRFIYYRLLDAIRSARTRIYFTTPYFIPDLGLFRVLWLAARRGVDVRILVNKASDHRSVDIAANSYFGPALKAGIKIYRYLPGILHAKTGVIDSDWAMIGSANLDNLSLYFNYEADLIHHQPRFVSELAGHFENDLERAELLTAYAWRSRPWSEKFLEILSWPFHKFF